MPKRKREPTLDEKLAQWRKELVRGLKTAKGFERQRLSKRIREADPEKAARLEREVAVLKSLDLQQAAHAHLCSTLLKIKGVAESPKLPADIQPVPKPELSEEERTALHNVTSALCNRKQVKDVIEEAVMGTCIALRVPMPEKKGKVKGKKSASERAEKEDQADDRDTKSKKGKKEKEVEEDSDESEEDQPDFKEPVLLKRKGEKLVDNADLASDDGSQSDDGPAFEGFSDSDAEERMFARYDDFVGGSSDEDEEDEDEDEDGSEEDELADSKAKSIRKAAADDISISSEDASEAEPSDSDSGTSAVSPPPRKAKATATKAATRAGDSAFLPTLMGGYISGSESEASDVDVAPPAKKNRRGQRARQAIWEKKYGDKAKHHAKPKAGGPRDQGWDMKRGAVDGGGGGGGPWKKGIRNPFDKSHVHPERQRQMHGGGGGGGGGSGGVQRQSRDDAVSERKPEPKPRPPPKRDDVGTLHPSWAAAKKAKEDIASVGFQGKKITFD
ncbi:Bud-site selection protein [Xylariomycetidae sp. FL0641]|nr:Bud-site selection protein [Xylariomycetidae sp. FL0641]